MTGFAGVLNLTVSGSDQFQGAAASEGGARVFGGHTAAQTLNAGFGTVEPDWECCFLHTQFPRAGNPALPIDYQVQRVSDSRNFALRIIVASQGGRAIAASTAQFQQPHDGVEFQSTALPDVPEPDGLARETDLYEAAVRARYPEGAGLQMLPSGIDARWTDPQDMLNPMVKPPENGMWLRVTGEVGNTIRERQLALAYCSDFGMIEPMLRVHGFSFLEPETVLASTLDHNIWFHRPTDIGEWHLRTTTCLSTHAGRGTVRGDIFDRQGRSVASIAQEGVIRRR